MSKQSLPNVSAISTSKEYKIKNTVYRVNGYYKKQASEMLPDKLLRMMKQDIENQNK